MIQIHFPLFLQSSQTIFLILLRLVPLCDLCLVTHLRILYKKIPFSTTHPLLLNSSLKYAKLWRFTANSDSSTYGILKRMVLENSVVEDTVSLRFASYLNRDNASTAAAARLSLSSGVQLEGIRIILHWLCRR